jgi:uncharacterized coiled-coil protein SlyX
VDPKDQQIKKLEKQLSLMEQAVKMLSAKIAYLERENNRRKSETNQITNHLRKN